ncbi:50S ribosomal protein L32 [Candidatus Roizmanbacteria bacterium]|nr:50S ribosomal protein L32 [Candidatus Roizmanbacteria bacterium]
MAPLPKRKHSTQRKGKRLQERDKTLPSLVVCSNCGSEKLPHRACKHCEK